MGDDPPTFDDWLVLLERYGLGSLKLSGDRADHADLAALRRAIAPFGLTLTERGLRQGRSVVDLVLSFSEAKSRAAADILDLERAAMDDRLRALVITDFERLASGSERADGALDRDAGSAFRAFRTLALDPRTSGLNPVLVTGTTVRTTTNLRPSCSNSCRRPAGPRASTWTWAAVSSMTSWRSIRPGRPGAPGSTSPSSVASSRPAARRSSSGTRALLGEGWDAPSANTLIDLTSVTTATGVQQLRGRILRLDPAWPTKTAQAYDVVCLDQTNERGGIELDRLVRRHERTWGIRPPGGEHPGEVVRGLAHLDPVLIRDLLSLSAAGSVAHDDDRRRTTASRAVAAARPRGRQRTDDGGRARARPDPGAVADRSAV